MATRTRTGGSSTPTWQVQRDIRRSAQPLGEYAYEAIRAGILSRRWLPGDPLSEQQLAEELGISRTPVRQALQHLEREGFVMVLPSRGTFVAELSLEDVRDVYELREVLEGQVARWAAERRADEDLAYLESVVADAFDALRRLGKFPRDLLSHGKLDRLHDLGDEFHSLLAQMAGNRRAIEALHQLDAQALRARLVHGTLRDPHEVWADHNLIMECVRERDGARAEAVMRRHLRIAYELIVQAAEEHS